MDKKKVTKILTKEEFEHINAFNIIPNLSDKVVDYAEKNLNFMDIISNNFEDKRKYNSKIPGELFVIAGIQARMKQQFSMGELSLAVTSQNIIEKLELSIEYDREKGLLKESNIRAFLGKYEEKKEVDKIEYNNFFIEKFNVINKSLLEKARISSNIHILDCSILDVALDNENYEGSSIAFKGGKYLRGYKVGLLRGCTPNGGVVEEICMGTAKAHDQEMSAEMILNSAYLKSGDFLLEDRGFIDVTTFQKLTEKGIKVIIPVKKNMEIYIAATQEAIANNKWSKHKNKKRKGQCIAIVEGLEMFWLSNNDKKKKPENIKLNYKINATVIRFEKELNKSVLTEAELIFEDEKYAYAVIITNDTTLIADEIIRMYEMRPEIEEDFRQLKDFWGLNTYLSTKYHIISFVTFISLLGYNLYQIYKESKEGENYIGKSFIVEQRQGLYIVKGVRTAIIIDSYFAMFRQDELLDLYVKLSIERRELLKELLVL